MSKKKLQELAKTFADKAVATAKLRRQTTANGKKRAAQSPAFVKDLAKY